MIRQNPDEAQWWIDAENAVGLNFTSRESYTELRNQAHRTPTLDFIAVFEEPTVGCFCGD